MLEQYKQQQLCAVEKAVKEVTADYTYCSKCKQWYKKKAWDVEEVKENRSYCKSWGLAEWDVPEYEDVPYCVEYSVCPVGHKFEVKKTMI